MTNREQLWCDVYTKVAKETLGWSSKQTADLAVEQYDKTFLDPGKSIPRNTELLSAANSIVNFAVEGKTPGMFIIDVSQYDRLVKAVKEYDE